VVRIIASQSHRPDALTSEGRRFSLRAWTGHRRAFSSYFNSEVTVVQVGGGGRVQDRKEGCTISCSAGRFLCAYSILANSEVPDPAVTGRPLGRRCRIPARGESSRQVVVVVTIACLLRGVCPVFATVVIR